MARDYKNRTRRNKKPTGFSGVAGWKWGLVVVLIALFIIFLIFLRNLASETKPNVVPSKTPKQNISIAKAPKKKPESPEFSFYTILPEKEVNVPDHEMYARVREENTGKGKKSTYRIQVGSFQLYAEADKLKARLALLGIESRIEKAIIVNVVWNRVRLGPYNSPSSAATVKKTLKEKGIDAKVTEIKG